MDPKKRRINLVENGIFPIQGVHKKDSTGYGRTGTYQGEGKLLGTPCIFVRTSGCNLRCAWIGADGKGSPCDTPYSSHKPERNMMRVESVLATVDAHLRETDIKYVVVSGGEPTLQTKPLGALLEGLQELGYHTTIETNGTIYDEKIAEHVNLISMSPKLSSSEPWEPNLKDTGIEFSQKWAERHRDDRINNETIQKYIDSCYEKDFYTDLLIRKNDKDFQLKFVVSKPEDFEEIEKDFLSKLKFWDPDDVTIMPEGVTTEDLSDRTQWAAKMALERGFRFTPRLHILMYGKNRYV